MTKIVLRANETQQQLPQRFRKKVAQSGRLTAVHQKRWFVAKSELRRIVKKNAIRRYQRSQRNGRRR